MSGVGIDSVTYHVYECASMIWYPIWPSPMLSVAAFVPSTGDLPAVDNDLTSAKCIFREDAFDPVARIRRGRFYSAPIGSRPSLTFVVPNAFLQGADLGIDMLAGKPRRSLFIFDQYQLGQEGLEKAVAIGSNNSLWRILSVERITTGEYLFTLKARHALGVLPELNAQAVPDIGREKAIETYEKLADAANRESPESIVDRARSAAQWLLATNNAVKFHDTSLLHRDLSDSIKKYEKEVGANGRKVLTSAARIIARLHSRAKPNEQEKRSLRPVMESDAEFALAAVGLILRELGWAQ